MNTLSRPVACSGTAVCAKSKLPRQQPRSYRQTTGIHPHRSAVQHLSQRGTFLPHAVAVQQEAAVESIDFEALMSSYVKAVQNSQYVEHSYWVDPSMIEGEVPKDLEGTLLRNGPGLFEIGGRKIAQPFDGDGLVAAFSFKDGKVHFRNKFVRTKGLVEEQKAGKQLFRSAFNAGAPEGELFWNPFEIVVKNIANTNVIHWGGKTLALYEVGRPHLLDSNLDTIGEETFGGLLPEEKSRFGAHYRVVPGPEGGEQRLVAFSAVEAVPDAEIKVWEFDQKFDLVHSSTYSLPGAAWGFFHDIAATPRYYIFLENPITFSLSTFLTKYLWGKACIAECLKFDPSKKVKVHLIPRPGAGPETKQQVIELDTPPAFTFHHANAFEAADGKVVLDTFCADFVDLGANADNVTTDYYRDMRRKYRMCRMVLDTTTGKAEKHVLLNRNSELPTISPQHHGFPSRHTYCYSETINRPGLFGPPQGLVKVTLNPSLGVSTPFDLAQVETDLWAPGPHRISQEPVFVPRPSARAEDDGWLLAVVYDMEANKSSLAILDAQNVSAGPLCSIHLPHHLPPGLHGSFTPSYLGPASTEEGNQAPYDIRQGL